MLPNDGVIRSADIFKTTVKESVQYLRSAIECTVTPVKYRIKAHPNIGSLRFYSKIYPVFEPTRI